MAKEYCKKLPHPYLPDFSVFVPLENDEQLDLFTPVQLCEKVVRNNKPARFVWVPV